ncbi:MAG: PSD1 domain-containing protein [Verrucomicrobiaceae bacterium]|nr:PSD1 domain-containing protein [Verrucomicrobiaceae bacterium]
MNSILTITLIGIATASVVAQEVVFSPEQIAFFEKSVRPVLAEHCYSCHGAEKAKSGLRLDSREAVLRGTDAGKVVIAGDPEGSSLIKSVRHAPGVEPMPVKKPQLAAAQIEALVQWVKMGLPWPKETAVAQSKPKWQEHWAFKPVAKPAAPSSVDALVGEKLTKAGLDFAPPADAAVLCRRLHLSLTGLPPSYEEVEQFKQAAAGGLPNAAAALIDKLLASPRYGERVGRMWLDVARYADTSGYAFSGQDSRFHNAHTYRDWVVKALNDDLPYDQFITEQIAADHLQAPGKPVGALAALGFLTVNDWFMGDAHLQIDDRIDVISRGLMGLTVSCARCHDHKYDPVPTADYYALYSVMNSCIVPPEFPVIGEAPDAAAAAAFKQKVAAVEGKKKAFREEVFTGLRKPDKLRDYLLFAQRATAMTPDAFKATAATEMFRESVAKKWRDFLTTYALVPQPHPVMLAWTEFAKLKEAEFAAKAPELAQRLAKPESGVNEVLRNEFAKRPPLKNFGELASLYQEVFLACFSGLVPDNPPWLEMRGLLQNPMSPMSVPAEGIDQFFTVKDSLRMQEFENELKKLVIEDPGAPLRAMTMQDRPQPADVNVFIRGNPSRLGALAPRGFLTMFGGRKFTKGSGRLELAQSIASKENPLTARVMVNRVWLLHFGKPLVSQPSDFGMQTPRPEQAELLDYLAATFMEEGWSLKKLQRLILISRTYQQSCASTPDKEVKDADNALLSRFNRLRLDYEQMRDSTLAACGSLNVAKAGGRATPLAAPDVDTRRSLYLFIDREVQASVPAMFDFANPDIHSPQRSVTTVPQQALFLINSPFIQTQSNKLAATLQASTGGVVDARTIEALYHRVLLRGPKPDEAEMALRFVNSAPPTPAPAPQTPLAQLAQVLLIGNEFQFAD